MRRTLILLLSAAAFTAEALSLRLDPTPELDACATADCASGLVCGLAIPQACNVSPCPKMPTCLPKNQTCAADSCSKDETCVLRIVTCIMAPCYPVRSCEKYPKCSTNEEYNECSLSGPCEPNCKDSFPICTNVTCGSGACECKPGYYRHEGKCISKDQCPTPTCEKPNEVWNTCPSACTQTCRILRGKEEQMMCPAVCGSPQCTCAVGFVRDDDWNCVKADDCPKEFKCDSPHEEYKECSSHCEPTCDNRSPSCIESCGPAKCQCKPNYVRNDGQCIFALQCPLEGNSTFSPLEPLVDPIYYPHIIDKESAESRESGEDSNEHHHHVLTCNTVKCGGNTSCIFKKGKPVCGNCGKNERRDECSNPCSETACGEPEGKMCKMAQICTQPVCVCEDGFVRNRKNGQCVKSSECPAGSNSTFLVDPLVHTRPLVRPAHPDNNETMHILPHFEDGNDTMHILPFPEDGAVHIMPELTWNELDGPSCDSIRCGGNTTCIFKNGKPVCGNCGKNEKREECPIPCSEAACGVPEGRMRKSMRICMQPTCVCEDGFVRNMNNGECVKSSENPAGNETMHILPFPEDGAVHIMPVVEHDGPSCDTIRCGSNTTCIFKKGKPVCGNCGKNERRDECSNPCSETACGEPEGKMCKMARICTQPACVCEDGFLRNRKNGQCVKSSECPAGSNSTFLVDPLVHTRPLVRPAHPPNDTMHIMPFPGDGAVHIMPVFENGTENGTMHIMPFPIQISPPFNGSTRPLIKPFQNGTFHTLPFITRENWNRTNPFIRPFFPSNETFNIMPISENGTMSILPFFPGRNGTFHTMPINENGTMHIMPFPGDGSVHIMPVDENGTMNILPFFPGNGSVHPMPAILPFPVYNATNGTMHILPFLPSNETMHIMPFPDKIPGFDNATMHILPFFPTENGTMHTMPFFGNASAHVRPAWGNGTMHILPYPIHVNRTENGTMHIMPFPGDGSVHIMPVTENGTMHILPFFPGNGSVHVKPVSENGTFHILPFINSSSVCANHTCPAGSWCEETPVMCFRAPCPPIPTCVSVSAGGGGAKDEPTNSSEESELTCGKHEDYSSCAPRCQDTCRGISDCVEVMMAAVCTPGCVCKKNYKRDSNGDCVPNKKCWKTAGCHENEVWHKCKPCEPTCEDSKEMCAAICSSGCGCDDGFVRSPSGECIAQDKCPKASTTSAPRPSNATTTRRAQ